MDAFYDSAGKILFGKGYSDKDISPTVEEVKNFFGEDTAELYARALKNGKFTSEDYAFAQATNEVNNALKALWGWTHIDNLESAAQMFIRDIKIDYVGGKNA